MSKDYGSFSVAKLKAELRKRNAKLTGKKATLVQRLHDYDTIFGNVVNDPESSYIIKVPDIRHFRDINRDSLMPLLNEEDLEVLSIVVEREDLDTSKKMYHDAFLLSARIAHVPGESGDAYFVLANCASEMRKQVSYTVTVKYEEHTIIETQCECAAGMGPYAQCKHILSILHGLVDFSRKTTLKTRSSCTGKLQTFHQPTKFYTGEPVEAENLKLKTRDANLQDMTKFDPRPPRTEKSVTDEKYIENFKSLVEKFCANEKVTMPIAQLMKPASKKAVFQDHHYTENTPEEQYLRSLKLNNDELKELESQTRTNKKLWKQQRLQRLQSSNFGKICHCKKNEAKLAKELLKDHEVMTAATKYGLKYEEKAVQAFAAKTGLLPKKCRIIVHEELQYLASTPDRLIGEDAVLEVKCPFSAQNEAISPENIQYLYLCDKTGELKLKKSHEYYFQVQGQLLCSRRSTAYFCVYTITDICIIKIARDESFISAMTKKLEEFYKIFHKQVFLNRNFYNVKT